MIEPDPPWPSRSDPGREQGRGPQVDLQHLVEVGAEVHDKFRIGDAGVVDQDIEAVVRGQGLRSKVLNSGGSARSTAIGVTATMIISEAPTERSGLAWSRPVITRVAPAAANAPSKISTDAPAGPGDQGPLAVKNPGHARARISSAVRGSVTS